MALNKNTARPLTSREIAKAVAALLDGFAGWCDPKEIADAMGHFHAHAHEYIVHWEKSHSIVKLERGE